MNISQGSRVGMGPGRGRDRGAAKEPAKRVTAVIAAKGKGIE